MKAGRRNRAFSLVEMMLVVVISAIILAAAWAVLAATMGNDQALRARVDLQLEASNALKEVTSLLKQSGATSSGGTYPIIYPLGQSLTAPGAGLTGVYAYANTCTVGSTQTDNTCVQAPNVMLEEGLGPSQGILFRIAKDQDHPDAQRTIPVTKVGSFAIEWGNEFHALTVAVNSATGISELQHQVWDALGTPKSRTVLAHYVSRLLFETSAVVPPAPTPLWPLPTGAVYAPLPWPLPPSNPYEIRVTLCLAKPDLANPSNSLHNPKRMTAVWQQTSVVMRSVPR